jgi:hypothetical protein
MKIGVGVAPSVGIGLGSSVLVGVGSGGVLVAVAVLVGISVGVRVGNGVRVEVPVGVSVGGHSTLDNGLAAMRAKNINNEVIIPAMILYFDILSYSFIVGLVEVYVIYHLHISIPSPPDILP